MSKPGITKTRSGLPPHVFVADLDDPLVCRWRGFTRQCRLLRANALHTTTPAPDTADRYEHEPPDEDY